MQDNDRHVRHDLERLAAYVDGRLDASARAEVTAHLARCSACRDYLAVLARGLSASAPRTPVSLGRWLPIAASLLIAAGGAGIYLLVRPPVAVAPVAPSPGPSGPAASVPTPPPSASASRAPIPPPAVPQHDVTRSASSRHVAGRTFRLVAGEWVDASYDPLAALPEVRVETAADMHAALERMPALRRYESLGRHFTVVLGGTAYRIDLR